MNKKKRNIHLDFVKVILAIFIVLFHTLFLKDYNEHASYVFLNGVFRIAVPFFFIVNGYYFELALRNSNSKDWIKRVLLLYVIWMILYSPFWITSNTSQNILTLIFGYHHLWYVSALLFSGLILIRLNKLKTNLIYLSVIFFTIGLVIQYMGNYHVFSDIKKIDKVLNKVFIHRNFLFIGIPFFIIGFKIKTNKWDNITNKKKPALLALLGFILLLIECNINYYLTPNEGYDNLLSLIILCPSLFLIFIQKNTFKTRINSKNIALLSTAIYLIHPSIIILLNEIGGFSSLIAISFTTLFLSFISSFFLIFLNKKIKVLL